MGCPTGFRKKPANLGADLSKPANKSGQAASWAAGSRRLGALDGAPLLRWVPPSVGWDADLTFCAGDKKTWRRLGGNLLEQRMEAAKEDAVEPVRRLLQLSQQDLMIMWT